MITGNASALQHELLVEPALVHARSRSTHHATLLHYTAANGIEGELQREVSNADEIASILLGAGTEPEALCDAYGARLTTLILLVSSDHPNQVGVAGRLVTILCSRGAAVDGFENDASPLVTALCYAHVDSVEALPAAGARTENVIFAAAASKTDWVRAWLDGDRHDDRQSIPASFPLSSDRKIAAEQALVFASMCDGSTSSGSLLIVALTLTHAHKVVTELEVHCIRPRCRVSWTSCDFFSSMAPIRASRTRDTMGRRLIGRSMCHADEE